MTRLRTDIKVWVTDAEKAEIARRAESANLSLSAYLRAAGLNHPIRIAIDINTISDLARIHDELGKYGLRDLQATIHEIMGRAVR